MHKYMGMSYEQLSKAAEKLIDKAKKTGEWHSIVESLCFIKAEMKRFAS